MPKRTLHFDIETDFDPERGFVDPSLYARSYGPHLQWLETMCLAVPKHLLWIQQRKNLKVLKT